MHVNILEELSHHPVKQTKQVFNIETKVPPNYLITEIYIFCDINVIKNQQILVCNFVKIDILQFNSIVSLMCQRHITI
jgi:hypothetical protein